MRQREIEILTQKDRDNIEKTTIFVKNGQYTTSYGIEIPANVTDIEYNAFAFCSALRSAVVDFTVEYINNNYDNENIIKSFASMIRYSCNNLKGEFALLRAASAPGSKEKQT